MPKVVTILSANTKLYGSDVVPFGPLGSKALVTSISEEFSFSGFGRKDDGTSVSWTEGGAQIDGSAIPIQELNVEPRRMILRVGGGNEGALRVSEALKTAIGKAVGHEFREEPQLVAWETVVVAELDFDFDQLVSERLRAFTKDHLVGDIKPEAADVRLRPQAISIRVSYENLASELAQRNYSLLDKEIRLEVRAGTLPEERVFFTASPVPSKIHLKTLAELEAVFSEG